MAINKDHLEELIANVDDPCLGLARGYLHVEQAINSALKRTVDKDTESWLLECKYYCLSKVVSLAEQIDDKLAAEASVGLCTTPQRLFESSNNKEWLRKAYLNNITTAYRFEALDDERHMTCISHAAAVAKRLLSISTTPDEKINWGAKAAIGFRDAADVHAIDGNITRAAWNYLIAGLCAEKVYNSTSEISTITQAKKWRGRAITYINEASMLHKHSSHYDRKAGLFYKLIRSARKRLH